MKHFNLTNRKILPQQGRSFLLWCLMMIGSLAFAQAQNVSGTISDDEGTALAGVSVLVQGTTIGVLSDNEGKYSISAKSGDVLIFSYIAFEPQTATVGDSRTLNITLKASTLEEVLVTGYATQRQKDITGAVSVVKADEMNEVAAASFIQKLEGRASGVTISTSGTPGDGTTVRIRGISGFGNNDPLYIIDGVPVQDAYQNGLNPNDIETIQVLKDASAASIYGARANNGVIIITTKKGSAGKTSITYNGYVGMQNPVGRYDLITNPADYSQVVWDAHENANLTVDPSVPYSAGRGVIPQYIYSGASSGYPGSDPVDESSYSYPSNLIMRANAAGTDWWDEVFDPALITEHTVGVSGGNNSARYYISGGYLDQQGTMINTWFKRASLRANSEITKGRLKFGENISLARSQGVSQPGGNQAEGNMMTQILKMQSIIPVYDVGGNYAGGKANGLSNGSNPVAILDRSRNNVGTYYRVLGNVFAEVEIIDGLKAKTSYGVDYFDNFDGGFNFPTWENSEPSTVNGWNESWTKGFTWTWTNTLNYNKTFGVNNLQVLAGYEAIRGSSRNINGSLANYFTTDINAWYLNTGLADPGSRAVGSSGGYNTLASAFGKVDYSFDDRYLVALTVRRDGSSNLGTQKYGTFPAVSVGWRVSSESFMQGLDWLDDMKVRFGWGKTGNQSIPSGRAFDQFGGGPASSFYAIGGGNGLAPGYALQSRGNPNIRWEENISTNVGLDASLAGGKFIFVLDLYQRSVDGLLYNPAIPNTAGIAGAPFVNIANMENRGMDISLDYRDNFGDFGVDLGIAFTAYRNEIVDIDGSTESFFSSGGDTRIGRTSINVINNPIGTFYGYTADGIFRSQEEVDAHATQDGAEVGRLRFKDLNADGVINDDDLGIIGSPHPDFTAGINIGLRYRNFDFTMFLYASQGNEIFNYNKLFEVFRFFNTNVRKEVLTEAFHPVNNPNGSLPMMNENDVFSERPSSFYVEDGSYLRAKQVQLGYKLPASACEKLGVSNVRLYLQAQNLFTLTKYSGIDPALSNFGVRGNSDQWNGNDFGNYPSSKIFMAGISLGI